MLGMLGGKRGMRGMPHLCGGTGAEGHYVYSHKQTNVKRNTKMCKNQEANNNKDANKFSFKLFLACTPVCLFLRNTVGCCLPEFSDLGSTGDPCSLFNSLPIFLSLSQPVFASAENVEHFLPAGNF